MTSPFSAVVLVAGRSTRMGRDKALLQVGGQTLWRRQRDVLAAAGASEIFLSARPEQLWTRTASGFTALLHDAQPGRGPLIGITAALERATHDHVAVLAIDLPGVRAGWFSELLQLCAANVGAVGRSAEHFEPLAAVYPRVLMHDAWQAIVANDYALQPFVGRAVAGGLLRVRDISPAEAPSFANWNEPRDVTSL